MILGRGVRRWVSVAVTAAAVLSLLVVLSNDEALAATGTAQATVAVQLSADPVSTGDPLTVSVAVTAADPASGVPSGSVQFTVDGASLGSVVGLVGGQASIPAAGLAVGHHQIGARYSGDGTFAAGDAGPGVTEVVVPRGTSAFVPVQPARILDTRTGTRPGAGATVTLPVAGHGGVPATGAVAVALNVTATDAQAPGYVTVWPADRPRPLASNLNLEFAGQTIPNLVVVPLSAAGAVNLYTQSSTNLVADVAGYFTAARSATAGRLVPLTPARLLDTRVGPRPAGGTTITLDVAGHGGVPASGASGVVLNVTATDTAGPGFVTVWPADRSRPLASNLNTTTAGQTIPNAVWVPLSATGTIDLYVSAATDLVVDVSGWFTGPAAQDSSTGLFVAAQPTRLLDTRTGGGKPAAGSTTRLTVAGAGPVPAIGAAAVVANVTATESDGPGFVTAYPAGAPLPLASNLNLEKRGQTRPNLVTTPLGGASVNLYTSVGTHLIADVAGYFTPDLNPAPAPTQHETYQPAAGTTVLDPARVSAVTGDPTNGYTVTLTAGTAAPPVHGGIVLKGGGTAYPDGLAGTVSSVAAGPGGTSVLHVTATPVDQLLADLDVGYDGPADIVPVPSGPAARRGLSPHDVVTGSSSIDHSVIDFGKGAFSCDVSTGVTISAAVVRFENTRVHFEKHVGLFTTPFVQFYLTTEPVVEFTGDVHGKVSCHLSDLFRNTHRLVWVLPTEIPVTVDLAPALQFDATIAGKASFTEHFYRMVGLTTNPDLSVHIYNAGSQVTEDAGLSAELSASLLIGADASVKVLDVAGIGVTLGPQFTASIDINACIRLTVALHADFDVRLNLWIKQFKYTFFSFDLGPWTVYYHCPGGGSGGGTGGPLAVTTRYLPTGAVGKPYTATLYADGGTPPYSWQVSGLPPGLASDSAGHLGGTPSGTGSSDLTLTVTDASGQQANGYVSLQVGSANPGSELVSVGTDGQPGNAPSSNAMRSADGRYVYFESSATNLTADHLSRQPSVYLRDRTAGTTARIDLPGDDGAANRLLAVSTNGRFALLLSTGATSVWRYDRQTGGAIAVSGGFSWASAYNVSDDGDLVSVGNWVGRLSDHSYVNLTCPNGTNTFYGPDYVRFAGNGSVIYFVTDECGQYWETAFRYDMATKTTTKVFGDCVYNDGNLCVEQMLPTVSDAHWAMKRLANVEPGPVYNILVDHSLVQGISALLWMCGISEDGSRVAYIAPDPGNTYMVLFSVDVATATTHQISPAGLSANCADRGYGGSSATVVYEFDQQIYLDPVP